MPPVPSLFDRKPFDRGTHNEPTSVSDSLRGILPPHWCVPMRADPGLHGFIVTWDLGEASCVSNRIGGAAGERSSAAWEHMHPDFRPLLRCDALMVYAEMPFNAPPTFWLVRPTWNQPPSAAWPRRAPEQFEAPDLLQALAAVDARFPVPGWFQEPDLKNESSGR